MTNKEEKGILTLYSDVQATSVRWLWYPELSEDATVVLEHEAGGMRGSK